MGRFTIIIMPLLLLSGCISPAEMAARQHAYRQNQCLNFGFPVGTQDFANCMMQLSLEDQRQDREDMRHLQTNTQRNMPRTCTTETNKKGRLVTTCY